MTTAGKRANWRWTVCVVWALVWGAVLLGSRGALAHGVKAGDLAIDHPYATPTRPGMTTGAVYFRAIQNNGTEPDRFPVVLTLQRAGEREVMVWVQTPRDRVPQESPH